MKNAVLRNSTLAAMLIVAGPAIAQRPPIIDMHLHVRAARYAGDNPPPMCTPFPIMPRSDPRAGIHEGMTFNTPPCDDPVPAAPTDEAVMRGTIDAM